MGKRPGFMVTRRNPSIEHTKASLGVPYRYALAIGIVLIGAGVRLMFLQALGMRAAFITFYPAVMVAALLGGFGPGLVATLLSAALADYFWIEPVKQFGITSSSDLLSIAIFLGNCAVISWITEAMHRARTRARMPKRRRGSP